jgi:hypothetical protein
MIRNAIPAVLLVAALALFAACEKGSLTTTTGGDSSTGDTDLNEGGATGDGDYNYIQDHITDIKCDASTDPCPEDLACWSIVGTGLVGAHCVDPNPEEWYCGGEANSTVALSYPPILSCEK